MLDVRCWTFDVQTRMTKRFECRSASGPTRAAFDPGQYVPHCTRHRSTALVPRCEHRMAGGRESRRRNRRCRSAGGKISRLGRRSAPIPARIAPIDRFERQRRRTQRQPGATPQVHGASGKLQALKARFTCGHNIERMIDLIENALSALGHMLICIPEAMPQASMR